LKIAKLKLKNFKGYETETIVDFSDLTAFVGKNDIGKSTILEALDIFFNDSSACVKLDKTDINIHSAERGDKTISITVCFKDLPSKIIIDSTNYTTLKQEYLLNENNELEITKKYPELDIKIMQDSFDDVQWLELFNKGVEKYSGINKVAQMENIKNENIIAFGDGLNDIDMIEKCGIGVAMKNALIDVKEKANFITDKTNLEDGIIDFLQKYL